MIERIIPLNQLKQQKMQEKQKASEKDPQEISAKVLAFAWTNLPMRPLPRAYLLFLTYGIFQSRSERPKHGTMYETCRNVPCSRIPVCNRIQVMRFLTLPYRPFIRRVPSTGGTWAKQSADDRVPCVFLVPTKALEHSTSVLAGNAQKEVKR